MQVPSVRKVCVIGAGTMGSGIAAHLANLGFEVSLLDVSLAAAQEGLDRAKSIRPPHFYLPERANTIKVGSVASHLELAAQADWVCEAIYEDLAVKRSLYELIDGIVGPDAFISTNTSGLPIALLVEGRSDSFRSRFLGTHFFNPPRYLKLLEIVPTEATRPEVATAMATFLEERVARRVVFAKDTPGFIANRFGVWAMFFAIHVAEKLHLSIEQVDAITGAFLGRPKSGSFRLNDLVGLDVMRDIAAGIVERCPDDPHMGVFESPRSMSALLSRGWLGEKKGRGYYRKEGKELLALDLGTLAYRDAQPVDLPALNELKDLPLAERVTQALERRDETGEFLRNYLVPTLAYADWLKERISRSVLDFDHVMEWGYGWQMGPFALADAIGHDRLGIPPDPFFDRGRHRGFDGFYHPIATEPRYRQPEDYPIISEGQTYRLRVMEDGAKIVSLTTKMGVLSPLALEELTGLLDNKGLDKFILTSEAKAFSAGFDLGYFLRHIELGAWDDLDAALVALQRLGEALERKTCVAAVFGHCLGGGYEVAVSCSHIVALAETRIGLPEAKVGLLPAGRGSTLMRLYNSNSPQRVAEVAICLAEGAVSENADHARTMGYLRSGDVTCYHPDALISRAKAVLDQAMPSERPAWRTIEAPLAGMIERQLDDLRRRERLTDHDRAIGEHIKNVIGRSSSYEDSLTRERKAFLDLCHKALSQARIRHMLEFGKPLRN